jgi:hypothetical protein
MEEQDDDLSAPPGVFGMCFTRSEYFKLFRSTSLSAPRRANILTNMSKLTKLENEAKTLSEELEVRRKQFSYQYLIHNHLF